jgi:hypothetical protein
MPVFCATIPRHLVVPPVRDQGGLNVGFKADTLATMKKFSNSLARAVRVMSILAPFTTVVATALWAVPSVAASHTKETARRAVATAVSAANDLPVRSAKRSLTYDGATAELKFAGARLSTKKDQSKPVVLLISDQKLPVENGRANST